MSRSAPHPDERLLTAESAAERVGVETARAFKALAAESDVLKAGRRYRGRAVFWLASSVASYCVDLPSAPTSSDVEEPSPR